MTRFLHKFSAVNLRILVFGIALAVAPAFSQSWEELDEVEEVTTRSSKTETSAGKLEGLFLDKNEGVGEKKVNIHFIFSDEPMYGITYFNYYDSAKKALVLDFYDSNLGSSLMDTIREYPIRNCQYQEMKIDFNEGVEGMKPDVRDMVRISLFTDYNFPYTLGMDEFDVLTLNFEWSREIEKKLSGPDLSSLWMFLLGTAVIGGLAAGTFFMF